MTSVPTLTARSGANAAPARKTVRPEASAEPEVRFCRIPEGGRVAYASLGKGAPLVMLPGWLSHLRELWTHPASASARRKLAGGRRFVWYDRLGCGLSDRSGMELSLDNDIEQLRAVLDDAGIERADLIGYSLGGPPAAAFARRYPERVGRLVFCSAFARGSIIGSEEQMTALKQVVRAHWGLGSRTLASMLVPNGSSQDITWFSRFQRLAARADMAERLLQHLWTLDVRDLLPELRVPTLILHNRDDRAIPLSAAEEIAALVPGARLDVLEGNEHDPFIRDSGAMVERILAFVDGRPPVEKLSRPERNGLTPREREVLRLVARGASNKRIAESLGIAVCTVERHVTNIYGKLDVRGRADAAMRAVAMGLVAPDAA